MSTYIVVYPNRVEQLIAINASAVAVGLITRYPASARVLEQAVRLLTVMNTTDSGRISCHRAGAITHIKCVSNMIADEGVYVMTELALKSLLSE